MYHIAVWYKNKSSYVNVIWLCGYFEYPVFVLISFIIYVYFLKSKNVNRVSCSLLIIIYASIM